MQDLQEKLLNELRNQEKHNKFLFAKLQESEALIKKLYKERVS